MFVECESEGCILFVFGCVVVVSWEKNPSCKRSIGNDESPVKWSKQRDERVKWYERKSKNEKKYCEFLPSKTSVMNLPSGSWNGGEYRRTRLSVIPFENLFYFSICPFFISQLQMDRRWSDHSSPLHLFAVFEWTFERELGRNSSSKESVKERSSSPPSSLITLLSKRGENSFPSILDRLFSVKVLPLSFPVTPFKGRRQCLPCHTALTGDDDDASWKVRETSLCNIVSLSSPISESEKERKSLRGMPSYSDVGVDVGCDDILETSWWDQGKMLELLSFLDSDEVDDDDRWWSLLSSPSTSASTINSQMKLFSLVLECPRLKSFYAISFLLSPLLLSSQNIVDKAEVVVGHMQYFVLSPSVCLFLFVTILHNKKEEKECVQYCRPIRFPLLYFDHKYDVLLFLLEGTHRCMRATAFDGCPCQGFLCSPSCFPVRNCDILIPFSSFMSSKDSVTTQDNNVRHLIVEHVVLRRGIFLVVPCSLSDTSHSDCNHGRRRWIFDSVPLFLIVSCVAWLSLNDDWFPDSPFVWEWVISPFLYQLD